MLPTRFLKSVLNSLLSPLAHIVNMSLQSGTFPNVLKTAVIKPLLKKSSLDATVLNNFRPISNLLFFGKVLEKAVYQQLTNFLQMNNSFELEQGESAFQVHAAKTWNSLPEHVRQASSVTLFKSRLKTFLFNCAYN
ncbi:hypothetical protein NL108_003324 [Boleophthalmus pectinirostris]|nr:hypothetical protein NL108_003324 [Boleophthalmus pectinirostris]